VTIYGVKLYACEVDGCEWVGPESEMLSDYVPGGEHGDESWSSHICPACGAWQIDLDEYELVDNGADG